MEIIWWSGRGRRNSKEEFGVRAESGGEGTSSLLPTPHLAAVTKTAVLLSLSHLGMFTVGRRWWSVIISPADGRGAFLGLCLLRALAVRAALQAEHRDLSLHCTWAWSEPGGWKHWFDHEPALAHSEIKKNKPSSLVHSSFLSLIQALNQAHLCTYYKNCQCSLTGAVIETTVCCFYKI